MGPLGLAATEDISSKSPLLALPNELLLDVARYLTHFRDLNALLRTSRFFYTLLHALLYRRVITANATVREAIALEVLSEADQVATLAHLLDNGLSVNHEFRTGFSEGNGLLQTLCWDDDTERTISMARLLLERGADVEAKAATHSTTVLQSAVYNNKCGITALLLAHGADPNAAPINGYTPLHFAAWHGYGDIAVLLLAHGADVNAASTLDGATPLHVSVECGHSDTASLLLAHGAAFDVRNDMGETLLLVAVRSCKTKIIPMLLAHGADADARDNLGRTPLHVASTSFISFSQDEHTSAKLLLEHGADVNAVENGGRTPLHSFVGDHHFCDGELSMPKFLLENGADVNAISKDGRSPLQEALSSCSHSKHCTKQLVALLIAHGADTSVLSSADARRVSSLVQIVR
jgi:ankyrin repeat protein